MALGRGRREIESEFCPMRPVDVASYHLIQSLKPSGEIRADEIFAATNKRIPTRLCVIRRARFAPVSATTKVKSVTQSSEAETLEETFMTFRIVDRPVIRLASVFIRRFGHPDEVC